MRSILIAILFAVLLCHSALAEQLEDGFYSVERRGADQQAMKPSSDREALAIYDPSFLGDEDDTEILYVVLRKNTWVPISLKEAPAKTADTTERTQFWLGIALSDKAAVQFEDFTRKHLGETMAIVVGGKVITMHKIKEVIKGGKIQISRCGDKGCEILYRELEDNLSD